MFEAFIRWIKKKEVWNLQKISEMNLSKSRLCVSFLLHLIGCENSTVVGVKISQLVTGPSVTQSGAAPGAAPVVARPVARPVAGGGAGVVKKFLEENRDACWSLLATVGCIIGLAPCVNCIIGEYNEKLLYPGGLLYPIGEPYPVFSKLPDVDRYTLYILKDEHLHDLEGWQNAGWREDYEKLKKKTDWNFAQKVRIQLAKLQPWFWALGCMCCLTGFCGMCSKMCNKNRKANQAVVPEVSIQSVQKHEEPQPVQRVKKVRKARGVRRR